METHSEILSDASNLLMGAVNYLDRERVRMVASYPDWDLDDTHAIRDRAIQILNMTIVKLQQL